MSKIHNEDSPNSTSTEQQTVGSCMMSNMQPCRKCTDKLKNLIPILTSVRWIQYALQLKCPIKHYTSIIYFTPKLVCVSVCLSACMYTRDQRTMITQLCMTFCLYILCLCAMFDVLMSADGFKSFQSLVLNLEYKVGPYTPDNPESSTLVGVIVRQS